MPGICLCFLILIVGVLESLALPSLRLGDEVRAAEMDASEVHSSIPVLSATNSTAQGNRTSAAKRCRGRGGVFYPVAVPFPVATGAGFRRPPMTAGQPMMYGQPMMAGHPMMMGHNMMWG